MSDTPTDGPSVSAHLEWSDPPPRLAESRRRKLLQVQAALDARPGTWAKIARESGISMFPWWGPFYADDNTDYEVRIVHDTPGQLFGPRDIYARRVAR